MAEQQRPMDATAQRLRVDDLADTVLGQTRVFSQHVLANGLKEPSFDADGPVDFAINDQSVETARKNVIEACLELVDLLQGPRMNLRPNLNGTPLQLLYAWNLPQHIPLVGSISFADLARLTKQPEPDVRRVVRYLIPFHRLFHEFRKGFVSHSAGSRLLATDDTTFQALGYGLEEVWQAFAHTPQARKANEGSTDPRYTGFSLAMGAGEKNVFEYYAEHPDKAKRFSAVMRAGTAGGSFETSFLAEVGPWRSLLPLPGNEEVIVVDVGGSRGHISIGIASIASNVTCICQDLDEAIVGAEIPDIVAGRVKMMAYNFFDTQPVVGAEVYLFSHIFHNWSDAHVLKILRNQAPAMKPGSKLVIYDAVLPEPNTLSLLEERDVRSMDMIMMSLFNSRERDQDDWSGLLKEAHPGYGNIRFHVPPNSPWCVIEATWQEVGSSMDP